MGYKPREKVQVVCVDCGHTFTAKTKRALRCEECRQTHLRNYKAANQARYRSLNYSKNKARRKAPPRSICEVLREMERYNKAHNTHYTYGQYVSLMETGKIE